LRLNLALSEKIMRTLLFMSLIVTTLLSAEARAYSCSRFVDSFISECSPKGCGEILYVKEISAFGPCGRRPSFAEPPQWAKKVLEFEVTESNQQSQKSLYRLNLRKHHWNEYFGFEDSVEYFKLRKDKNNSLSEFGNLEILQDSTLEKERELWETEIQKENLVNILKQVLHWVILAISVVFLCLSVVWFISWLEGQRSWRWPMVGVLIHIVLAYVTITGSMLSMYFLPTLLGLFVPGIWLCFVILGVKEYLRRKRT